MKLLPFLLLTVCACMRDHATAAVEVRGTDCVTCHLANYQSANPPHVGNFPTTCADCHSTTAWIPAIGGAHPEASFPVAQGAHQGITCQNCHDASMGTSVGGANTNCIRCHTQPENAGAHTGVANYSFDSGMPHFCLTCHPDGRAGHHPEANFPIASGRHSGIACADCHNRSLGPDTGGGNTDCIGCHTGEHSQTRMANAHTDVSRYTWDAAMPHFCLSCHPSGRGGG